MKKTILAILTMALFIISCGNETEHKTTTHETETTVDEVIEEEDTDSEDMDESDEVISKDVKEITLVINSSDQMMFDKKELHAYTGQKVTLTLNHTGQLPKATMGHNWVLLKEGTDIKAFAELATAAKDNDYIPESDEIIVHTKTIGGGESSTITFDAPEAGTYEYICSFPGHFGVMRGKFIVE